MNPAHQRFFTDLFDRHSLDGYLCTALPELRYLTSFSGSDGVALVLLDELVFLCDSRYVQQAKEQARAERVVQYATKIEGIKGALGAGKKRIGFNASSLTVDFYQKLSQQCDAIEWVVVENGLDPLRMVKTTDELALLAQVASLHAKGFKAIEPMLTPGTVERDIAVQLEYELKRLGGEEKAFDYIVASGERGAMPHGVASEKCLANDELVTLDFGTRVRGYHSDETVTVGIGQVPDKLLQIHAIVLEAHDRAMAAVAPGIPLKEVDQIARDFIASKGYGDYFGHGLGHGVGLEIHEAPVVSQRSEVIATENMVFTIEPGIYIEGLGGVRIEDTVVVTNDGCRALTVLPKQYSAY